MTIDHASVTYRMVEPTIAEASVLAEIYDEILRPAFPADELCDPWPRLGSEPAPGELPVAVAFDGEGRVAGAAVGEWYAASTTLLLGYLAVRARIRGGGIGAKLLEIAVEDWRAATGAALVLAEIEDPRFHLPSHGGDPTARVAFYERHGTRALDAPYFQPRLHPDGNRVYHLLLSPIWADPALAAAPGELTAAPVRTFLDEYFAACEGVAPGDADDELRNLLAAYDGETLPVAPIGDYAAFGDWHVAGCGHS